ncbi:DUF3103 family protein [Streptomyces atratus]|uniref:DUF3103 domain-containing protein n=1 Tax=Streptomyces atratus TaxID=1893 RepID=A0A2Z5J6B6_STRAR|nr:DUF3103 family protein [Streptomyces atratus]AXE75829.1 DUF3103 domain-containing protein [Streptomyces atratus]
MSASTPLRTTLIGVVLATTALIPLQGTALAAQSGTTGTVTTDSSVTGIEDATALALARSLADPAWNRQVRTAALAADSVDLGALTGDATSAAGQRLAPEVVRANQGVAAAKGLTDEAGSLLRLGLADASIKVRLASGTAPLVAAAPSDDASTFTAYDSQGTAHELSVNAIPERPVYLVDIDGAKAVAEGLKVVDEALRAKGLNAPAPATGVSTLAATTGIDTTRINSVRISDVKEPAIKGDAEIFTLVTGFGKDGKPRVDTVEMPYLNKAATTYYPNQVLVNWSNYKYNMADAVMMEDDGDTNYQSLAKAIVAVLLTITDQGAYIPLADAVLNAIPTSWWTDDPDYVDSWYTLAKTTSGTRNGAAGNGWMNVSPYHVSEL